MTPECQAHVVAVQDNIVSITLNDDAANAALMRNEVVHILPRKRNSQGEQEQLKAEILRVLGNSADIQVYEDTRGVGIGDPVQLSGQLLTIDLGPGLLGQIFDGLQNPLERLALEHGRFLKRGAYADALDDQQKWAFKAEKHLGDQLVCGQPLGHVQEGHFQHNIMVPNTAEGEWQLDWIKEGNVTVDTVVARLSNKAGKELDITLRQSWPIRMPFSKPLLSQGSHQRCYPDTPLITTIRLIDTFFPIARGGTACIPGPFGAGKTVLQQLIARYSDVDIVVMVACGERAGEVVETITEFPKMQDPKGGGSLMDRTVIICNTSSMPVAAREASIYTGITIGEYYRQMGLNVLLIADSTSRWAQAMRERSGRLEEIPGEEAFPAYLESSVRNLYERAGVISRIENTPGEGQQQSGSLTMIGTVSPAGGNFEEPVTQATLNTVKAFLGLSAERAYKRFYPAVDPLLSWSRYREQLSLWHQQHLGKDWQEQVAAMETLLHEGEAVLRMMQVTGEEGVSMADFIRYQKALCLDMVYLQQDAFDAVDVTTPLARQHKIFKYLVKILEKEYHFANKQAVQEFFTRLTSLLKNMNYSVLDSEDFRRYERQVDEIVKAVLDDKAD